ncbi:hypothetical protein HY631_01870, partial [Candidatus Uhrbacteria bacterium]|nr:hypothetical protein [Candidatus Uhrbacteria bacterium]
PEKIGGGLYLRSLTSAQGLTLPEKVVEFVYLGGLSWMRRFILKKQRPDLEISP